MGRCQPLVIFALLALAVLGQSQDGENMVQRALPQRRGGLGEAVELAGAAVDDTRFENARQRAKKALGRLMDDVRQRREQEQR